MPNCGEGVERLARRMRGFQAPCIRWQAHTPKAFSLRRRWAALAARMRCSRRSGVILYIAMITAISWPTPHQSALADSFSSRRSLLAAALMEQCGLAASWSCCLLKARLWKPSPGREKVSSDSETDEGEGSILLMLEDAVTKSLLLEEKVLNAVKRMRCSRCSGVILYKYFANGYFVAYDPHNSA